MLIMLNLSATFDVIDHPCLLKRLEFSLGIKENALTELTSYIADRTQCISVADIISLDVGLFAILRGSVLGPKNYRMYAKSVGAIIKRHNIKYHWYADDTQVYMSLKRCDKWDDIPSSIGACIEDISTLKNNKILKLNKDKTQFVVFSSK